MIVINMENDVINQLAKEIAQSQNRQYILDEIEWLLNGHYTKCRFLALLMANQLFKKEYYKLSEKLTDRNLLQKLYELILKNMNE